MHWTLRCFLLTPALALAGQVNACLNDRDSLYLESMGHRDLVKTVVGWFPVHSPLFYQMRIHRSLREIDAHPNKYGLYDDVAVAYDKLGDDLSALKTIERKKVALQS